MRRLRIDDEITSLMEECVRRLGKNNLMAILSKAASSSNHSTSALTIMANEGLHKIPPRFIHGELYIATTGNLVFSSPTVIVRQYKNVLSKLKAKLLERRWNKIYLIPTGHPTLSLQIKSLVYHALRMDTIDLFYSAGKYFELVIGRKSYLNERFH